MMPQKPQRFGMLTLTIVLLAGAVMADDVTLTVVLVKPPTANTPEVQAIVAVLDGNEKPIKGLGNANFSASIQGAQLGALMVRPATESEGIAVVLALDVSGSMKGQPMDAALAAAGQFVDQMGEKDVCALVSFGGGNTVVNDFTANRGSLKAALASLKAVEKTTYLYQALFDTASKAAVAPLTRSAVVILTDGRDENSPISLDDAISNAVKRSVPIYPLAFGAKVQSQPLQRIATLTGGRFLFGPDASALRDLYALVQEQLQNQYLISVPVNTIAAGQHDLTITLSYRGVVREAVRTFQSIPFGPTAPSTTGARDVPTPASSTKEPPTAHSQAQKDPPLRAVLNWLRSNLRLVIIIVASAIFVLVTAIIAVILLRRRRLPSANKSLCGLCGQPLVVGEEQHCQKCVIKNSQVRQTAIPEDKHLKTVAILDPQVWIDLVKGPEDVRIGQRVPLTWQGISIGRGPDNAINLNDRSVSIAHAKIESDPDGNYQIEDLQSLNGTFVNNKRIKQTKIRNGDRIQIGATELEFVDHREP